MADISPHHRPGDRALILSRVFLINKQSTTLVDANMSTSCIRFEIDLSGDVTFTVIQRMQQPLCFSDRKLCSVHSTSPQLTVKTIDIDLLWGNYSLGFSITVHNTTNASAWFGNIEVFEWGCPGQEPGNNLGIGGQTTKKKPDAANQIFKTESKSLT